MKPYISLLFLTVSVFFKVVGQDHFFRPYANEEGLNHSYIYSMNQDGDGFMWIGTAEGLYKFNGLDFEYFTKEDGLSDNFIREIFKDKRGNLWIGHQNGSITLQVENKFITLNDQADIAGSVMDMAEDDQGLIWVAKQNQGLLFINNERTLVPVSFTIEEESLTQIEYLGKGYFLIGSQENLYLSQFISESASMEVVKKVDSYPGSKVVKIFPESSEDFMVVSQRDGFFRFSFDSLSGDFKLAAMDDNSDGALEILQGGLLDSKGAIWLYSIGNGILEYKKDQNGAYSRATVISTHNGLASENVRSLFEDMEGNLWLGMYGEGLLKYSDSKLKFYNFGEGSGSPGITAIATNNDNLLLATDKLLMFINAAGDTVLSTYPLPNKPERDKVNSAYFSEDGRLWLGFEQSGLYVSGSDNFNFRRVTISKDDLANSINHITGDSSYLWIGTKKGICRISTGNGDIMWFTRENGLPHNNIQQLYIDSWGRVLVGTLCSEIHFIQNNENIALLENSNIGPQNLIMSFYESEDGTIWAGTQGNGVWKIQGSSTNFSRASGLLSNFCYSLHHSAEGEIVIGHRGGISVIGNESKRIKTYSQFEGIISSTEFFPNAVMIDHAGNIWFGTSEGLIQYSINEPKGAKMPPVLRINSLYIDGEERKAGEDLIKLKSGQHEVAVEFIGLHFTNPEMVVYQTQLDGYNADWSDPTMDRRIVYERLEHGNYTFKIRAFNENDVGSEIVSAFRLSINKPVYLTIWFYGIIAVMLGLSFYWILRVREQNHKMEQERLLKNLDEKSKEIIVKEEIIKERKKVEKILIEAKAKAESSEKLKTAFLQNMSHEIRTPMNAIVGFSQLLKEEDLPMESRNEFIKTVSTNAESLLQLIDNILDLSKLETTQLEIEKNYCRVNPILSKLETTFLQRMQNEGKEGIDFQKICPGDDSLELLTDSSRLEQILYHLLDNALKFTERGKITVGYSVEEADIKFYVEDTGIGLSEDKKDIVFDLFRKVEDDRIKLYGGTGLGLTLAKYLVNILGGEINLDSEAGVGSTFYFNLPLK